jgi:hypothetical protein
MTHKVMSIVESQSESLYIENISNQSYKSINLVFKDLKTFKIFVIQYMYYMPVYYLTNSLLSKKGQFQPEVCSRSYH